MSTSGMRARGSKIAGAVLAAGCSSRMGQNKLLLEWKGKSLLRHAVSVAAAAGLDPLVVVIGFEADRAGDELVGEPCRLVVNPEHALGMHSSAAAAADAVAQEADALVIMLADMPLVSATMLEAIQEEYLGSSGSLVLSRYGEVTAPPTLFDRSLFPYLQSMEEGPLKPLVERFRSEASVIDWSPLLLRDIDTQEDFEALLDRGA